MTSICCVGVGCTAGVTVGVVAERGCGSGSSYNHLEVVFDLPDTSTLFSGHAYVPYNIQSSEELNGKLKI